MRTTIVNSNRMNRFSEITQQFLGDFVWIVISSSQRMFCRRNTCGYGHTICVYMSSFSYHFGAIAYQKLTVLWLTACQDHFASQESVFPVHFSTSAGMNTTLPPFSELTPNEKETSNYECTHQIGLFDALLSSFVKYYLLQGHKYVKSEM